jgi:hypothetical protein
LAAFISQSTPRKVKGNDPSLLFFVIVFFREIRPCILFSFPLRRKDSKLFLPAGLCYWRWTNPWMLAHLNDSSKKKFKKSGFFLQKYLERKARLKWAVSDTKFNTQDQGI